MLARPDAIDELLSVAERRSFSTGSMLTVALYGKHGLLDKRPADDDTDAVRVLVEIVRERGKLKAGERFEIQPFRYAVAAS